VARPSYSGERIAAIEQVFYHLIMDTLAGRSHAAALLAPQGCWCSFISGDEWRRSTVGSDFARWQVTDAVISCVPYQRSGHILMFILTVRLLFIAHLQSAASPLFFLHFKRQNPVFFLEVHTLAIGHALVY